MLKEKCALCGTPTEKQGNEAWSLCPTCQNTLPVMSTEYVPEKEVEMGTPGNDNQIVHGAGSYRGDLQQVAGPIWRVKSESSEKWYTVDLQIPKCDCTDWATKRNKLVSQARTQGKPDSSVTYECKHCRAARQAAEMVNHNEQSEQRKQLAQKTAKIKAEFAAKKTKRNALDMLKELGEL